MRGILYQPFTKRLLNIIMSHGIRSKYEMCLRATKRKEEI